MDPEPLEELQALLQTVSESASDPKIEVDGDTIRLTSFSGGPVIQVLFLAIVVGPPLWLFLDDPDTLSYLAGAGWLLIFGRTWIALALSDVETRIHLRDETLAVANTNPVLGRLRQLFPWRQRWEGEYRWSEVARFFTESRIYTKTITGYMLMFKTVDGMKVPMGSFENASTAWHAAEIFTRLLRLSPPPPTS